MPRRPHLERLRRTAAALGVRPRWGAEQGQRGSSKPPHTSGSQGSGASDSDLPSWVGSNRSIPIGLRWLLAGLVVVVGALAVWLSWWLLLVLVLLVAAPLITVRFEVRIDREGLRVTILGGRRMLEVPLEQVADAEVARIDHPLWSFGGWGLRTDRAGRTAVVTRDGTALLVRRHDGSEVLITVDEAWSAAAALNLLVGRSRRGQHDDPER